MPSACLQEEDRLTVGVGGRLGEHRRWAVGGASTLFFMGASAGRWQALPIDLGRYIASHRRRMNLLGTGTNLRTGGRERKEERQV